MGKKEFEFAVYTRCADGLAVYAVNASARDGASMIASILYLDPIATILIRSASDLYALDRIAIYGLFAGGYQVDKRGAVADVTLYRGEALPEAVKAAIDAAEEVLT